VLLGDSYTLGVGVHESDTFAVRLEQLLNGDTHSRETKLKYEVVNCGVSGFGTREERLYFHHTGVKYQPNLVLLVMVFNDDMSFVDEVKRGYLRRPSEMESLFLTWHIVQHVRHRRPFPDFAPCLNELRHLNDEVKSRGAVLAVVHFRTTIAYTELWDDELATTIHDGLKNSDIASLNLGPILLTTHPNEVLTVHPFDAHPNEIAHRNAANAIRDFLHREGLLPSTHPGRK
jgi:hypothetical protein